MERMKTFFKYFIIIIGFYILSNVLIWLCLKKPVNRNSNLVTEDDKQLLNDIVTINENIEYPM